MIGTAGSSRGGPARRLPEPVLAAGHLLRLVAGRRLTDGQDPRSLAAEARAGLADARRRFDLPAGWHLRRTLTTVGDVAVIEIWDGAGPAAVLKLSRSPVGTANLRQQHEVLALLAGDPRLGEFRRLLPDVLAGGAIGSRCYLLERAIPGAVGTSLPEPLARGALHGAVTAITALHRGTGRREVATRTLVDGWLDPALARVADVPMLLGRARKHALIAALRERIRGGLEGRAVWVSRVHGDYCPGNIIYGTADVGTAPATVAGIIDWAQSRDREPAWVDCMTLQLVSRALRRRIELGAAVREACEEASPLPAESSLLAAHRAACPGDEVAWDVMALVGWLRHVECNLEKSPRYAAHPVWVRRNIEQVLVVAGGAQPPGGRRTGSGTPARTASPRA